MKYMGHGGYSEIWCDTLADVSLCRDRLSTYREPQYRALQEIYRKFTASMSLNRYIICSHSS